MTIPAPGDSTCVEVQTFSINPALPSVTRWLAPIANRYERYKFRKLVFHYTPTCSTATPGSVVLAFDFDPLDDPPEDLDTAQRFTQSLRMQAFAPNTFSIDLRQDAREPRFTRPGEISKQHDLKTYDLGQLHVLQLGVPTTVSPGFITVDYVVDLISPQYSTDVGGSVASTGGLTKENLVGTTLTPDANSILPVVSALAGADRVLKFTSDWEGIITQLITGTNLSGTNTTAIEGRGVYQALNAGVEATKVLALGRAKAYLGDVLKPSWSAADTVTGTIFDFASGNYNAFGV